MSWCEEATIKQKKRSKLTTQIGVKRGVVIAFLNAKNPKSLCDIELLLKEQSIHILVLYKTKIDQNFSNEIVENNEYTFIRPDRNRNQGGVSIHCRKSMQCTRRNDIPLSDSEIICIDVMPKAKPCIRISNCKMKHLPSDIVEK